MDNTDENKTNKRTCKFLFLGFFIFFIILGIQLSYNHDFTKNYDLIFDTDPARVITDMTSITESHPKSTIHPLLVILIQPIYFIISGIVQNKMLALVLILSMATSVSITILYKIISLFSSNEKINVLLSICYGLIFSNFIFTATVELYSIAALILILFWYFIALKIKEGWKKADFIILITLGVLTLSITITNFVVFLIGCFTLFLSKKVSLKKLLLVNVLVIVIFVMFDGLQLIVWKNTPLAINIFKSVNSQERYIDFSINLTKIKNVIKDSIFNSFIASDIRLNPKGTTNSHPMLVFKEMGLYNKLIIGSFLLITAWFVLKNFRKNFYLNIGIILTLTFNFMFHIVYGNNCCFLYSLHFMYLIFLLFGINYTDKKILEKPLYYYLILLLVTEAVMNWQAFKKILVIIPSVLEKNFYAQNFEIEILIAITFVVILVAISILYLIYNFVKKMLKCEDSTDKTKYLIFTFVSIILFETIFVLIQTIPK